MASFGEGFAGGLGQGMAMGKMLMDTYNDYDQKDKLAKAGQLDQEEINTPAVVGADGVETTPAMKQYRLGNKTQDKAFTADQVARHRDDARAQVLMDNGDVKGAYGLRAAAREERKGQQWEDINQNQINDLQALAEGKYDQLRGTIDKGVERYNNAQSGPYADNHRISIDWNKNQAIVTGPKNEVVKTIPITQQTAASFIRSYYDDLRSAANPEYGLKSREVSAKETSAQADYDYKKAGGVAERLGMANVAAHRAAIGAMNPAQAYALEQAKKFDVAKGAILADLEDGKITEQQAAKKIGILGMKFGQSAGGLGKSDEAQVEFNPDTGETKIKGTVSAVEAAKAKNPQTRAAAGDLSVTQPTKNQTGVNTPRDAQEATPAKPDLSKWTMKPAGKTMWGETDYVLEGPNGRISLGDFIKKYGYNPSAEFIGRR